MKTKQFIATLLILFSSNAWADTIGFMECSFSNEKTLKLDLSFGGSKHVAIQQAQYYPTQAGFPVNVEGQMNQSGESNLQFLQTTSGFTLVNTGGGSVSAIQVSYDHPINQYLGDLAYEGSPHPAIFSVADMVITYKNKSVMQEETFYKITTGLCAVSLVPQPPIYEHEPGEM